MLKRLCTVVFLMCFLAATLLTGCGGGGGTADRDMEADSRVEEIIEGADTLLIPGIQGRFSITAQGQTVRETAAVALSCAGVRCTDNDGDVVVLLGDLVDDEIEAEVTSTTIGERGGFHTATAASRIDPRLLDDEAVWTSLPEAKGYGLWGEHGYALTSLMDGSISGVSEGTSFTGTMSVVMPAALGDATGTNPGGMGGATWRGIADAVSVATYSRHEGTAAVSIPDLANPSVNVDVMIGNRSIAKPSWRGIALSDGRYSAGTFGSDRVAGDFYGPGHEETYGVFGTDAFVGAFGAKREVSRIQLTR